MTEHKLGDTIVLKNNENDFFLNTKDNTCKRLKRGTMVYIDSDQVEKDKALNRVFQTNSLIKKPYKLTAVEKKIILWVISKIKPQDKDFFTYRISINAIQRLLGLENPVRYKKWKKVFNDLRKKDVPISIDEEGTELFVTWFASCRFNEKGGWAELEISRRLAPYLLNIKNRIKEEKGFTAFRLGMTLMLKSVYSIRIYELMKYAEFQGGVEVELEEFRKILGINGIKAYLDYKIINRDVLKPAQKELEESTDIKFTYEAKKWGRKTGAIKFYIFTNEKNLSKEDIKDAIVSKIPEGILNLIPQGTELNKTLYELLLQTYNKDPLDAEWAIKYTNAMTPKNYQAYLRQVIENRYYDGMKQMHLKEIEKEKIEQEQNQKIATEEIERKKQIQQEQAEAEKIMDQFNELLEEERENIIEEYKAQMPKNQKSYFKANMKGIYSLSIRPYFCDFLKEKNYVPDG